MLVGGLLCCGKILYRVFWLFPVWESLAQKTGYHEALRCNSRFLIGGPLLSNQLSGSQRWQRSSYGWGT